MNLDTVLNCVQLLMVWLTVYPLDSKIDGVSFSQWKAILLFRVLTAKPVTIQFVLFTLMIMLLKKVHFIVGSEYWASFVIFFKFRRLLCHSAHYSIFCLFVTGCSVTYVSSCNCCWTLSGLTWRNSAGSVSRYWLSQFMRVLPFLQDESLNHPSATKNTSFPFFLT